MPEKTKVLIIEDEPMLLEMYSLKLEKEGFKVSSACDGQAGIKQAQQIQPDIILLDVMLPKTDGFSVLQQLKSQATFKNTPVIMLTNLGQAEDLKKGQDLGAADYLVKSDQTPAQVVAKVKGLLKNKKS